MTMASLKTYTPDELIQILDDCSRYLHWAYQETNDADLRFTSTEAALAKNFLQYIHHYNHDNHTVH